MTSAMIYLGDRLGLVPRARRAAAGHERASSPRAPASTSAGCASGCTRRARPACSSTAARSASRSRPKAPRCSPTRAHPAFGGGLLLAPAADDRRASSSCPRRSAPGSACPTTRSGPRARAASSAASRRGSARCWCRSRCRASPGVVARARRAAPRRRRRLRRGRRAARDGEGVPALDASTATTSRSTRSQRAEENRAEAGVANARFHDARREPLPGDASFDFVTTFDCLHDMTDPARRDRGDPRARSAPTAPG